MYYILWTDAHTIFLYCYTSYKIMEEIDLSKKLPEKSFRAGPVKVSVWRNKTEEGRSFYSVSLEKQYKDDENEWHVTHSLNKNDIPKAVLALQEA